jgi:hypothetical protein
MGFPRLTPQRIRILRSSIGSGNINIAINISDRPVDNPASAGSFVARQYGGRVSGSVS